MCLLAQSFRWRGQQSCKLSSPPNTVRNLHRKSSLRHSHKRLPMLLAGAINGEILRIGGGCTMSKGLTQDISDDGG